MARSKTQPEGLKIFRHPTNLEIHRQDRNTLIEEFPDHFLFYSDSMDTNILRRRESRAILAGSPAEKRLRPELIAARALTKGARTAKRTLSLSPKRLQFVPYPEGNTYRIAVMLDDPEGYLEEERASYIKVLGRVAGKESLTFASTYVPHMELGLVHQGGSPSLEALKALTNFIPDPIELDKVRTDPRPIFK